MNMLVDQLPENVEIGGVEYPIRSDFRTSILFELLIQDDEMDAKDKIMPALNLYYPEIPQNISEAVDKLLWFYRCGKNTDDIRNDSGNAEGAPNKVYSFEYDDDYIYAAFLEQYGIDLQDVKYLHWWKFRALFKSLGENTEFVKIMGYRSMKISSKMSKEQKDFYKHMQEIHALPMSDREKEANAILTETLINGGDLTGLI